MDEELDQAHSDEHPGARADVSGWADYHAATSNLPPRPLLVRALRYISGPGDALDLGCGAGNDARYLLGLGFRVTAVDAEDAAIAALSGLDPDHLTAISCRFDTFSFEPDAYDLINAQLALPFNPPRTFAGVFAGIKRALRPGGLFTGHFFGQNDGWNVPGTSLTFNTPLEVEALLDGLDVLDLRELENDIVLANGEPHHAHAFEVIARHPQAR